MIRLKQIVATAGLLFCCFATYAQTISNKGKEFWVGYGHHQFMEAGSNDMNMVLYLSTEEQGAIVTVTIDSSGNSALPPNTPGGLWSKTYNLPPFTVIESAIIPKGPTNAPTPFDANYDARYFDIAPPAGTGGAGIFRKRTIHIVSTAPIVAYAHIYGSASSGATMLMPVTAWGYSYMSLNSEQSYASNCYNWMYVIASKDNTVIEITPSVKTRAQDRTGLAPNVTKQVTLMKGQAYQVIGANTGADANGNGGSASTGFSLSGTKVKSVGGSLGSCYPIAVFAGSSRTANPASCGSGGGDNDNQQLFPFHAWGRRYLTVPFSGSDNANSFATCTYKIGVMDPTTVVTRNGVPVTGLNLGKFYKYESNTPDYIEADKPIMVTQFMTGGGCLGTGGDGDPEMVVLAPIEQSIKQVGFYRNTKEFIDENFVTLTVPTAGLTSLRIDNSFTFDVVKPHPRLPGYSIVVKRWAPAAKAQVFIKCDSAFNAITYGLGSVESYGYSAGAYINNLNSLPGIHNIPDTANGGKNFHKYTCVNTPDSISILLSYRTLKLNWDFTQAGFAAGCWKSTPAFNGHFLMDPADSYLVDSNVIIDGKKYYKYTLPYVFSFSCPGTYDIPVVSTSPGIDNCGNNDYLFVTVDVKAAPIVNFTISHPTKCTKDSIRLTGPAAGLSGGTLPMLLSQWSWGLPPGIQGHSKDTAIVTVPGTAIPIRLSAVTDQGCLSDTVTKTINVLAPPTTVLTALPDTVCLGQSITFKQVASYGDPTVPINNYFWDFGDVTTANGIATTQAHTYGSSNTYTAKAVVRVSGLCVGDTATKVVYVGSKAKIGFTYPTSCLPSSGLAQFVANSTAQGGASIVSYTWDFGDPASGSNTASGQTVSHTYAPTADSFKVTLTVVTSTGCSGDTSIWVNANIAPSLGWSSSANFNSVCQDKPPFSLAFGTVLNGIQGTPKYSGGSYIDSAGMFDPALAGPGVHPIRYTFTSTKGCIEYKDTTITVYPTPAKPVVVSPVTYCQNGTAVQLSATAGAGNTLMWYDNVALTGGSTTAPTPSTSAPGTFKYYVTQTSSNSCTGPAEVITVNVQPSISSNNIGTDSTICQGNPSAVLAGTATLSGGDNAYTYQWQESNDGSSWANISGATSATYDPGTLSATKYYRRVVASGLCDNTSNPVKITIVPAITNNTIANVPAICEGNIPDPIVGQAISGTGVVYSWQNSPDNSTWTEISGATGKDYQPPILTASTYYRRKVENGPCSNVSSSIKVTVNKKADGNITAPAAICQYNTADITFVATTGTAPFSIAYTITNPSGTTGAPQTASNLANNAVIPLLPAGSIAGQYTVTLTSITNSNNCVRNSGFTPVSLTVTATPVVDVNVSPATTVCEGTPVTLTANGATTYDWTGSDLSSTTGNVVIASPPGSGSFSYSVTGKVNACNSVPKDLTVTVNPKPSKPAVVSPVTFLQNGSSTALSATPAGSNILTWYNNSALTGGTSSAPVPSTTTPGTYTFYVTQTTAAGCTGDPETITVIIEPSITGNTIAKDTTICEGGTPNALVGTGTLAGGNGAYTYQWQQSPDGTAWSNISGATSASYNAPALTVTTYYRRIVTSGLSASTSNTVTVTVMPALTNYNIATVPPICEGSTSSLIVGQVTPGSSIVYSWESSTDGVNWSVISGATGADYQPVSVSVTTYYRRKVTNGPCTAVSNIDTLTVNPLANGSISGTPAICQYDAGSVTFTSATGTAPFTVRLTVTDPSGTVSALPPQSVNSGGTISVIPANSAAGTYTIALSSLTNSNGCIRTTGLNSISIVVTATPVVTLDPAGPICEGQSAPLAAHGATTYIWSSASQSMNLSSTSGSNVTTAPSSAGSYTYTVIGTTNGCNSDPANGTLVVNPKPGKPSVVTPVTYCQLGPATQLQATASGSNTLKWYDNPGLTGGVTTAPTPSTANAGNFLYYVTQTNSFSCESDTAITTIVVNPGITGNTISGGETICQGSTPSTPLNNAGTLAGGDGSYAYQWQQSTDGGSNWTNISGATNSNYSPATLNTTTQFRRVVTSSLCGSISNVVTETVLIGLGNYDISASQTVCEAAPVALLDGQSTTGTGPFTYTWQQSSDNVNWTDISSSNTEDYQPPALTATTYYRRKVTNGPCTGYSSSVQIFVKPLANGNIAATTAAICEYEADSVRFTSTVGTGSFVIGLSIINPAGVTSTQTPTVNSGDVISVIPFNSAPGNYTVTLTSITSNGCTRSTGLNSITITIKPTPVIVINDVTICEGDTATITAGGATTYTWGPSGAGLLNTTGNPVKANPAANTVYTVTGTTNGCSASKPVSVFVNPKPVVHIQASKKVLCLDDNVSFSLTSSIASGNIATYSWDFDNGNTSTSINPPVQTYSTHRTYVTKLYAVSDKNCTSATDTVHITVNPLPVAAFAPPGFVCLPDNAATFQNQSTVANGVQLNYAWNFGDPASGAANTSTATNGSHVYPDSARYTVTLSVVSAQGCTDQTTSDFEAFFKKPVAKFGVTPDTLCQGIQNLFTDSSFAPGSVINKRIWAFGDGSTLLDSANAAKTYTRPGNYTINLTVQNTQGCTAAVSKNVLVYLQPVIDAGSSFIVPAGTTVTFNASANSNTLQFAWTSPTGATVSDPTILKPQYLADQDAKFILTATGQGNCKAWDSLTIKVLHPIAIPNAFSPNGDGINEKWEIKNLVDYPNCVVEVFNRYGQPVFRSFGYTSPWDGTVKGKPLPVGTYYYIIEPKNGFPTVTGYVVIVK